MSIFRTSMIGDECCLEEQPGLWNALELNGNDMKIISITGAGGKTSVMFRLAEELNMMGKRVIVTTSTHIQYPENYQTVLIERASQLKHINWEDGILVVGGRVEEAVMFSGCAGETMAPKGRERCWKLAGMEPSQIALLADWCDVVLIEADGSKRLSLFLSVCPPVAATPARSKLTSCQAVMG